MDVHKNTKITLKSQFWSDFIIMYTALLWPSLHGPQYDKPVFGVSDKVRFRPVSSATDTS